MSEPERRVWTIEECARVLDKYDPTWFERVHTESLAMEDPNNCVIAQAFNYQEDERTISQLFGSAATEFRFKGELRSVFASPVATAGWVEAVKCRQNPEFRLRRQLSELARAFFAKQYDRVTEILVEEKVARAVVSYEAIAD